MRLRSTRCCRCTLSDPRTRSPFDQHFDCSIWQLQKLQHRSKRADVVNLIDIRIVVSGILLRRQKDVLVRTHHLFEGIDRFIAPDEQRHDHVREYNDIAQRQDRKKLLTATDFCCH